MIADDQHGATTLTGIAGVLSAIGWPILVSTLVFCYRKTLREILPILVEKLRVADSVELPGFKIAQASRVIQEAVREAASAPASNSVPEPQVKGAQSLEAKLTSAGISSRESASLIEAQVVGLANEYSRLRATMESGEERTLLMDTVMAKMRTLGIRLFPLLDRTAVSFEAGERLAAIAALQVQPDYRYFHWLTERFYVEVPFVFFQASLAIGEAARKFGMPTYARRELQDALDHILKHPRPDQQTVQALQQILSA